MKPAEATETGVTPGRNQTNLDFLTSDLTKNTDVVTHKINKQSRKLTIGETEHIWVAFWSRLDCQQPQNESSGSKQIKIMVSDCGFWFQTTCNSLSFKLKLIMLT